tara:strand:- start:135 stop:521 length:387 start_codon:yes stop_codon:yes gene_type:complete
MNNLKQIDLDNIAISLSALCAIHCLFVPITILFFPAFAFSFLASESFHTFLLFFVIPVSVLAMFLGCNKHKKYHVLSYGIIGLIILLFTALFAHDLVGENGEILLTLTGVSVLSFGHYKNQQLCKLFC